MTWIEIENTTPRKVAKWKRSAALSDDGTVYVPAAICGDEKTAILNASFDGVSMVTHLNHAYLPTSWMEKEYPKTQDLCDIIKEKIQRVVSNNKEID